MTPVMVLRGQQVGLGPIRKEDLGRIHMWWNDPEIMLPLSGVVWPRTEREVEEWYEKQASPTDHSTVNFAVYELSSEAIVGCVALAQINYRSQTAWPSSYIGDQRLQGCGYGTEARQLLIQYAFDILGLHSLTVAIHTDNPASLRVAEKVGYRVIGTQRQSCRRFGQRVDAILLDLLADEWRASQ